MDLLLLILLTLCGLFTTSPGKILFVDGGNPRATDVDNNCSNSSFPCSTLNHAAMMANETGDEIQVQPTAAGYSITSTMRFDHPVRIINSDRAHGRVVLSAASLRDRIFIFDLVESDGKVVLEGLMLSGGSVEDGDGGCVLVEHTHFANASGNRFHVVDCEFVGCESMGGGGMWLMISWVFLIR